MGHRENLTAPDNNGPNLRMGPFIVLGDAFPCFINRHSREFPVRGRKPAGARHSGFSVCCWTLLRVTITGRFGG